MCILRICLQNFSEFMQLSSYLRMNLKPILRNRLKTKIRMRIRCIVNSLFTLGYVANGYLSRENLDILI